MGICKCVYKHSLLGELNVTLEIGFSNQVYVATAVDSVYGVCISPIYIRASSWPRGPKSSPGGSLGGGGERKDIRLGFHRSFCTRQANSLLTSGRCLSLHRTKKVLLLQPGCLLQTRRHLVYPSITGLGGDCVCCILSDPLSHGSSLPPAPLTRETHRQT